MVQHLLAKSCDGVGDRGPLDNLLDERLSGGFQGTHLLTYQPFPGCLNAGWPPEFHRQKQGAEHQGGCALVPQEPPKPGSPAPGPEAPEEGAGVAPSQPGEWTVQNLCCSIPFSSPAGTSLCRPHMGYAGAYIKRSNRRRGPQGG